MSKCIHANKLHDNLWCSTACMYCTLSQEETCRHRKDVPGTKDAKTNADHIRSMTDEELADFLDSVYCHGWSKGANGFSDVDPYYHDWIKQPYGGDT